MRFTVACESPQPVIGVIEDQIVTEHLEIDVPVKDGGWTFDPEVDLAMIACVQRHDGSGDTGVSLVRGFGFRREGAFGSSVGHDAHNLTIAGTNGEDMALAVRTLKEMGGGFVVVARGNVVTSMPLPVAGLMSDRPAEEVVAAQRELGEAAAALGCPLHAPFGTLSFLALTVIPTLKITDQGLFDVAKFALV